MFQLRILLRVLPAVLVAGLLTAGAALADDDGGLVMTLIGSTPGQVVGGVPSGGAPWVVSRGHVTLGAGGHINVVVHGLILPATGNTGPVTQVNASLVCGGSGGSVVASTAASPLSAMGAAHIKDKITVPASCVAPVVLVRVAAVASGATTTIPPFIAVTGFSSSSSAAKPSGDSDSDH